MVYIWYIFRGVFRAQVNFALFSPFFLSLLKLLKNQCRQVLRCYLARKTTWKNKNLIKRFYRALS